MALPNKGRLAEAAVRLLEAIGGTPSVPTDARRLSEPRAARRYEIHYASPWDIPEYVARGAVDLGITGRDIVLEVGAPVEERLALPFGYCRLSVAAVSGHPADRPEEIPVGARVATSYPNLVREYFRGLGRKIDIVPARGAVEVAPRIGAAEFIADLVETGRTLRANDLKLLGSILDSQAVLIGPARPAPRGARDGGVRELESAFRSVVEAAHRRCLLARIPRARLPEIQGWLDPESALTVSELVGGGDEVALQAAVPEAGLDGLVGRLLGVGARGIMVLPLQRVIP
ncbi:MAG: ATP phosphoribosyltransferase [Thermoplasmata archaeon]